MAVIKRIYYSLTFHTTSNFKAQRLTLESLPAIVLRNMRYSKLEISLLCQRWVMLEDLKSCRGVAREMRLGNTFKQKKKWKLVILLKSKHILYMS